jgi:hypothetical protein
VIGRRVFPYNDIELPIRAGFCKSQRTLGKVVDELCNADITVHRARIKESACVSFDTS